MGDTTNEYFTEWNESSESFDQMNLHENLLRGIYAYGFEKPSAIQQKGIVPFGKGLDVIQQAQSGTGKTATFCAGILQVRLLLPAGTVAGSGRCSGSLEAAAAWSQQQEEHRREKQQYKCWRNWSWGRPPSSMSVQAGGGSTPMRLHPMRQHWNVERQQGIFRQRRHCS
jgi:hypothetical protein